jgi:hypothetical protein
MSELFVDTVKTQDGTKSISTTNVVDSYGGSAKFYINFNGQSTPIVSKSLNHSSLTDNGTGDYTFNFTNNMDGAYYSHVGASYFDGSSTAVFTFGLRENTTWSGERSASLIRYESIYVNTTNNRTNFDPDEATLTINGDLA